MTRGGPRPGSGAPRGNLNALKNGTRSRRLAPLYRALDPLAAEVLTAALVRVSADALAAIPPGDAQHAQLARSLARKYALRRVLACLAAVERNPPSRAAFSRDVIRALGPVFLNREENAVWSSAAQRTTREKANNQAQHENQCFT